MDNRPKISLLPDGRGGFSWKEGDRKQTPTLEGFAEEFLAYQKTLNRPSELANKEMILRVHLLPVFGKRRLDQIDERSIDAYKVAKLDQVTRRGKPYNPNTVNKHLELLARILRVARKWKLIREVPEVGLLKPRKTEFDFLTFEEGKAFVAAAREYGPQWHAFVVVAMRTGLRVGELVALRWREDLDLDRRRLTVNQSYGKKNGFTSTKSDKIRELPLTWDAVAALEAQRDLVGDSSELVFPGEEGKVLSANTANDVLEDISEAAGIRRIHNHVLRHTFASHAAMRGIPMRQVQEWLGHGSVVVTMRYAHLARGVGDDLIRRLAPEPDDAAWSQHMDGPEKCDQPKSPPHTPVRRRS